MAETAERRNAAKAPAWKGLRVDGIGGTLGRVAGIHVDAEDGEPRWVVIKLRAFSGSTGLPYEHVAEGAGRLFAAYGREWVRAAPRFRHNDALNREEEIELCAHWGIRPERGRGAEVDDRAAGEITAVPASQGRH